MFIFINKLSCQTLTTKPLKNTLTEILRRLSISKYRCGLGAYTPYESTYRNDLLHASTLWPKCCSQKLL